jgi:hypothetical protein
LVYGNAYAPAFSVIKHKLFEFLHGKTGLKGMLMYDLLAELKKGL